MELRKINTPAHGHHPDLHLGYRQTSDGTWYIEWRRTPYSLKPIAIRRAWDTEIQLIERIQALEHRLRNPNAPQPVRELKLRTFVYKPPGKPT